MTKKADDINEKHRKFWEDRKKRTDELLAHLPTAKLASAEYQMHAEDETFEKQKPFDLMVDKAYKTITQHGEALRSVVNSLNARAPRPKKKPTHKSIVLAAMRLAQRDDKGLDAFIVGAANDGYDGIKLERLTTEKGEFYSIYCNDMIPTNVDEEDDQALADAKIAATIERSYKAISGWWTEANTPEKS